jgi:hypothetical protein
VAERIAELQALGEQLLAAEHAVSTAPGDGACGPGCACLATPDTPRGALTGCASPTVGPVEPALFRSRPAASDLDAADCVDDPSLVLACTLDAGQIPERLAAWGELVFLARSREATERGERLVFTPAPGLAARISDLCAREQACCPFLTFTLHLSLAHLDLEVAAPDGAAGLVTALLGEHR